jgi:hypothetical protein
MDLQDLVAAQVGQPARRNQANQIGSLKDRPDVPLLGSVGRIAAEKGLDDLP